MRSYRAHRRFRIGVVALVGIGVAAPILAHAFASDPPRKVEAVGAATTFSARSTAHVTTALPPAAGNGDFLVSYVETSPQSSVTCADGWIKRLDVVNGTTTRLTACTHLRSAGDPRPAATIAPAASASMVTMAFSNVDLVTPVAGASGNSGLLGPRVDVATDNSMVVLAEGSPHWRVDFTPPTAARKTAITNDGTGSELAAAVMSVAHKGTHPTGIWKHVPRVVPNESPAARAAAAQDDLESTPKSISAAIVLNLAAPTVVTTTVASTTTTTTGGQSGAPSEPPARICGNRSTLDGPANAPSGAVTVPAGDNGSRTWNANTTYWFAPGVHTLGTGEYDQIIPADHDTFVGAPGAILDGQRHNDFAFTQHASNVTVQYLTIRNFTAPLDQGVVNHDSANGWTIANNSIVDNQGAAMMAGANQVVRDNCLDSNGQYALNAYQADNGITALVVDHNEISNNNTGNWEKVDPGCGCTGGLKLWAVRGAQLTNNYVHDNHGVGLWADTNNVAVEIGGNYISNNDGEGIMYEASYNADIHDNTLVGNAWKYGPTNPGFPTGAIYVSESGGDSRVSSQYSTFEISGNVLVNNWSGVILWENADRFCNSPANPSKDCTEGGHASLSTCVAGTIDHAPYYSDCRWKTQNISVHDNSFELDASKVPGCVLSKGCGLNGVFSQWGTYPSWSPYENQAIEDAITFHQNNVFANNTYTGPWRIMAHDQGTELALDVWQASPYRQDANSTMKP